MAVGQSREHAVLVHSEPGAAGTRVPAPHDPWRAAEQARRFRRPLVKLIAVRRNDEREVGPYLKCERKDAHGSWPSRKRTETTALGSGLAGLQPAFGFSAAAPGFSSFGVLFNSNFAQSDIGSTGRFQCRQRD